ncbi:hypothetical protein BDW62DRAFT_187648 [Aspergillus aurantiobrunneus]
MNNPAAATIALSQSNLQYSASNTLGTPAATQNQIQNQSQPQPSAGQQQQQQSQPHDTTITTTTQPTAHSHPTLYPHQVTGDGGPTATAPFLRDFSLVAEAAKRAQVAIVTRDLEGVSL